MELVGFVERVRLNRSPRVAHGLRLREVCVGVLQSIFAFRSAYNDAEYQNSKYLIVAITKRGLLVQSGLLGDDVQMQFAAFVANSLTRKMAAADPSNSACWTTTVNFNTKLSQFDDALAYGD